jgi:ABC-type lipoprotein export system ATPase subunit
MINKIYVLIGKQGSGKTTLLELAEADADFMIKIASVAKTLNAELTVIEIKDNRNAI